MEKLADIGKELKRKGGYAGVPKLTRSDDTSESNALKSDGQDLDSVFIGKLFPSYSGNRRKTFSAFYQGTVSKLFGKLSKGLFYIVGFQCTVFMLLLMHGSGNNLRELPDFISKIKILSRGHRGTEKSLYYYFCFCFLFYSSFLSVRFFVYTGHTATNIV